MHIALREPTHIALDRICMLMRAEDRTEIFNQQPTDNPLIYAYGLYHQLHEHGFGRIAWLNGIPVLVGGLLERWPKVWEIFMFGTDECKPAMFAMMRWLRAKIREIYSTLNVHRIVCESRHDHTEAHRFLRTMGARQESTLRMHGKDGSDYLQFVWLADQADKLLNLKEH